ncbi:MAG: acetylxylan esterase [Fimbriimonadaceae bacterium]|nr:acetylxylan esterase [Fimbriimonadaceae bacterium]
MTARWLLVGLCAWHAAGAAVTLQVTTDRPDGLYQAGEQVTFSLAATTDGQPLTAGTVNWSLSKDGVGTLGQGTLDLAAPQPITGTLNEPGVLRLSARYTDGTTPVDAWGGAGFDLAKIGPSAPEPADFDAWWTAQKQLVAAIPLDAQLTRSDKFSTAEVEVFELSLANLNGSRVRGWFCRPAAPGKYPALLQIPGAGVGPTGPAAWSGRTALSINISVHDYPVTETKEFFTALAGQGGALFDYSRQGRESRETYYFRRVFLSFVRCIDFLTGQADWDGRNMQVTGSSQGGASTLTACGLDQRVTAGCANVPAMCDHTGLLVGRASGWPRLIPTADAQNVVTTAGYFDAVNFARRIKCPILVSLGLIDRTCPATTVAAAYNLIPAAGKKLIVYPRMGHEVPPDWSKEVTAFLEANRR